MLDMEIGKAHLLASPTLGPAETTVCYTSNKAICQKTNLIPGITKNNLTS